MKPRILVIVGPTASGKSDLAVKLAKKLNGEVISADSRQVYKGLDIGTGKITTKEMEGIPHHVLDVVEPTNRFTVTEYMKIANSAITDILERGKLPIICGGTGFYIDSLISGTHLPPVSANESLREELANKTAVELLQQLKEIDPIRAKRISSNPSDRHNNRRIIRAIEIAQAGESIPTSSKESEYDPTFIGLSIPINELRTKIHARLLKRIDAGMIEEVQKLHEHGLSYERMEELGLEYRYVARFLQGHITKDEMIEKLSIEIGKYAKRQMTWFRKDTRIHWFETADVSEIEKTITG